MTAPLSITVKINGVPIDAELPPAAVEALRRALGGSEGPTPARPFIPASEAALLLGRKADRSGRRRVYDLVADGRLIRHGDGRRLLVSRAEVLALAAGEGLPRR